MYKNTIRVQRRRSLQVGECRNGPWVEKWHLSESWKKYTSGDADKAGHPAKKERYMKRKAVNDGRQ